MPILRHIPVMKDQAVNSLNVRNNLNYVDATFGYGSYSAEILKRADCNLISIDKDPTVIQYAEKFKSKYKNRFSFFSETFSNLKNVINEKKLNYISGGIIADLGVSSMQIDDEKRGFSFMKDGPLDMRMNKIGMTAKDLIYLLNEKQLSHILWTYGEEKQSRIIARSIINERKKKNIDTTFKLVEIINLAKKNNKKSKIHPATKTFQALRIAVNDELKSLETFLKSAERVLLPGARLVTVTFHSLEDRIVKVFFNKLSGLESNVNRHYPDPKKQKVIKFKKINKKPFSPSKEEIEKNIRSRSAKLRVIERIAV